MVTSLVLNADPRWPGAGAFPLDPTDDAFVGVARNTSWRVAVVGTPHSWWTSSGSGTVFAALSKDPLQPGDFALNGHWDYRNFKLDSDDDEVALRPLAERMAPAGSRYDFSQYFISLVHRSCKRR